MKKCELCGCGVEAVGDVTKHYEPIELHQLRAENAVLVDALKGLMQMNREIFGNHLFAAFRAGKDDFHKAWMNAEHALANTSEQAKALISVIEKAKTMFHENQFSLKKQDVEELELTLAAYDKIKDGLK